MPEPFRSPTGTAYPFSWVRGRGNRAYLSDTLWLTNVTHPTLTVYQPPKAHHTGTAMLICPGGGYWSLGWDLEGTEVADWLNSIDLTGIVLKYRVPRRPSQPVALPPAGPLQDAQRAQPRAKQGSRVGSRSEADRHDRLFGRCASDTRNSHQL